ncbi:MAG: sugar ABC transporter permease [Chitinispirillaceae bacterium]|nr:sugar ABC transporter permease [Chitinispirillaceae bacterium]
MGKRISRASSDTVWLAVLLMPALLLPVALILMPALCTFVNGCMQDVTFMPRRWAGLANYARLVQDPALFHSLRFTLLFIAVSVPLELACGLLLALLMQVQSPLRGMLRALVLIPWAIPAAIAGRVWELIYSYNWGPANYLVKLTGAPAVNWLGSSTGAFLAIVIADLWKTVPFVAIILLAGLSAIPEHLYRQAEVDGASFIRRFVAITLPLLRPVMIVAILFRTIDALRIFDLIYILTSGGPGGATSSLSLLGYTYFVGGDFGYGSAISTLIFLIALLVALLVVRIGRFGSSMR